MSRFPGYPPLQPNFNRENFESLVQQLNDLSEQLENILQGGIDLNNRALATISLDITDAMIVNGTRRQISKPRSLGNRRVFDANIVRIDSTAEWQTEVFDVNWQEAGNNAINLWFVSPTITSDESRTYTMRIAIEGE